MRSEDVSVQGGSVAWGRVALYYAIAFGMVSLLAAGFAMVGASFQVDRVSVVYQLIVAFVYMPMPMVAGLIVERVAGRRPLIRDTVRSLKEGWKRIVLVSVTAAVGIYVFNIVLTGLLGNLLGMYGVGHLVTTQTELLNTVLAMIPTVDSSAVPNVPSVGLLYAIGLAAGIVAGFTINGLFAFGEEYGWRGVLMDELGPLGPVRANTLTGVMWGLWHAPLILLGFNYGADRWLGVLMMCLWVTPISFILWRARQYSQSVLAPAIIHGALNGSSGFFLFLIAGKSTLIGAPVGLVGALAMTVVAALVWRVTAPGIARSQSVP